MRAALALAALLAAAACGKGDRSAEQSPAPAPPAGPSADATTAAPAPVPGAPPDAAPAPATAAPDAAPAGKPKQGGKDSSETATALQEEAARYADLLVGTMSSDGEGQPLDGEMRDRAPGGDLVRQLGEVREGEKQVQIGSGSGRGTRGSGDPRIGTGKGPRIDGPDGSNPPTPPPPSDWTVKITSFRAFDEVDPAPLRGRIESVYLAGLRQCVKRAATEMNVPERIRIDLRITDTGRAVSFHVGGAVGTLHECIKLRVSSWRFPAQKDADGEPTEPELGIELRATRAP